MYRLVPNVAQGLNVDQRVGNEIMPKSLRIQLALQLVQPGANIVPGGNNYSSPENITCHIFILKSREVQDQQDASNVDIAHMMSPYNGQRSGPFTGDYWPSREPVNKNLFTVIHHKKIHMRKGAGWYSFVNNANVMGTAQPTVPCQDGAYSSPDQAVVELTLNVPMPKKLVYINETAEQPRNFFPFMCIGWTKNEYPLTQAWNRDFTPLAVSARTYFKYTDF